MEAKEARTARRSGLRLQAPGDSGGSSCTPAIMKLYERLSASLDTDTDPGCVVRLGCL